MRHRIHALLGALLASVVVIGSAVCGESLVQLDPFARATSGVRNCAVPPPPMLTEQEARAESHARVERGTRCAMEGTCEPGGAYRRDPELNEQVRARIAGDARFATSSVWLITSRRWVTLRGCVHSSTQRRALVEAVKHERGVERVFDELTVVPAPSRH
ncbi:MAG TPA: BON domain-containing protein [Casimicrobiaceae bacterium]|nr:BON domain-containing protein [Casimicrobiaceae bacterium]